MRYADKIDALASFHEEECNRYHNGSCSTLRCLRRGGYVRPEISEYSTAVHQGRETDYSIATCEAHETVLILRAISQIDRLLAREERDSDYAACEHMRKLWPELKAAT